jgi:hypothetical protein
MKEIVFKTNKKKIARMFGIFAIAAPLSFMGAYFVPRILDHVIGVLPILIIVLVYLICVVSLIGLIAGGIRLFSNKFDLTLDINGIRNNAEFGKVGLVKWNEIEKIELGASGLNNGIAIFLKDPQSYVGRFSGLKKQGVGLLSVKYGTPCFINVMALDANTEDVFMEMQKFLDSHKSNSPH